MQSMERETQAFTPAPRDRRQSRLIESCHNAANLSEHLLRSLSSTGRAEDDSQGDDVHPGQRTPHAPGMIDIDEQDQAEAHGA